jgi:hypothetical protein
MIDRNDDRFSFIKFLFNAQNKEYKNNLSPRHQIQGMTQAQKLIG